MKNRTDLRYRRPKRKFILQKSLQLLGISSINLTRYATSVEPHHIETIYHDIPIPNLPKSFHNFSIVQLTDLHHSGMVTLDYLKSCVEKAIDLAPDIIVMTGDYISYDHNYAEPLARLIGEMTASAKIPVFAVLGNHDHFDPDEPVRNRWGDSGRTVANALDRHGIHVMMNETITLRRRSDRISLVGCGDLHAGKFDPELALRQISDFKLPKIMLMHNPEGIDQIADFGFDLVLSGHTHGGQIYLPTTLSKIGKNYVAGLFNVDRSRLYVCRGVGVVNIPFRFMARPEIAHFQLLKA